MSNHTENDTAASAAPRGPGRAGRPTRPARSEPGDAADGTDGTRTVLWVSAHPEPRSLNGALRRDGIAHLRRLGHSVIESDLYAMEWDPVLRPRDGGRVERPGADTAGCDEPPERFRVSADTRQALLTGRQPADVVREQAKLERAAAIVLQFPLWWYGMPALMKGWFDRVFVSGFAFGTDPETGRRLRFEQGPFRQKRALVVTTLGDRPHAIGPRGKSGELHELLFGLLHGTFAYTGMDVLSPWALPSADRIEDTAPVRRSLRTRLDGLFTEAPLPYRPQFTGQYTPEWELAPHVLPGQSGLSVHLDEPACGCG
ncbi:NAD(P)H-dependent oxidoreductase [Brachybacterium sp. GCM10030267]|uniref:NAD(P)H-dependent oxidoreductase n=1 Tax=unclassified Brachybacterium TaxID=2623841 RepID=UPI003614AEB9